MDNNLKVTQPNPCEHCPDKEITIAMPPAEYQWIALTPDDQEILQSPGTNEQKYLKDIDTKNLKRFALRDWEGRDLFGIDVVERAFVLLGKYIRVDLPEGRYEVKYMILNEGNTAGNIERTHILGLVGEEQERYLYIYPDKHVEITGRFK